MPKALPDRESKHELAKSLFIQDFNPVQIARKIGVNANTVGTWARRGNWTALRSKTCEALTEPGEKLVAMTLAEQSAAVREALATDLEQSAQLLPKLKQSSKPVEFKQRQEAVGKLADNAAVVFEWNQQPSGVNFNFAILESDNPVELPSPPPA